MFETVVLALDGSEPSDDALTSTMALARKHGSSVHVVHVIEILAGRGGGPVRIDEEEIKAKVRRQVKELEDAGIETHLELHSVMVGGPAHVVADVARRVGGDLIVTGTRGHTALAGIVSAASPSVCSNSPGARSSSSRTARRYARPSGPQPARTSTERHVRERRAGTVRTVVRQWER